MSEIIGLVTARGGSKSIPRKNVKPLAGKPLIAWTVEAALQSRGLSRVIVSTDDNEIAQVAQEWGAEVPFVRPSELAQDDSPHIAAVEHAIRWLAAHDNSRPDYIMTLQPTSPLRTAGDIDAAIQIAETHAAIAVVSVCETDHHPYLSKRILPDGTLADFVSSDIVYLRRQALPPAYVLNGAVYLNHRESLLRDQTFLPKGARAYVMPPERSLDINTELDFRFAEFTLGYSKDVAALFLFPHTSLHDTLICLETTRRGIVLIVDGDRHLLGVITDGDVRRAVLAGLDLTVPAEELLDRKAKPSEPITAPVSMPRNELISLMRKTRVSHIPILNETGRVVGLVGLDDLLPEGTMPPATKLAV